MERGDKPSPNSERRCHGFKIKTRKTLSYLKIIKRRNFIQVKTRRVTNKNKLKENESNRSKRELSGGQTDSGESRIAKIY